MSRCVVFLWAAALLAQQDQITNPRRSPADVVQGEKTFRSHCSPCHGLKGEGGRGPNLAAGTFYHGSTDADLLRNISNGIDGTEMPGLFYSPDRVWQVVAYVRSLNASPHRFPAATVSAGEALFQRERCGECHLVNGAGGRMGPDLSSIGMTRSVDHLRQSVLDPNADVRQRYCVVTAVDDAGKTLGGFLMNEDTYTVQFIDTSGQLHSIEKAGLRSLKIERVSKMPSYKAKLSDDEVNALVAYLSSLRPAGGAK
jgi:putative heme-binding domain-containing protein